MTEKIVPFVCVIKGCDKPEHGHGMCSMHLSRWRRWGDVRREPKTPAVRAKGYTLEERFWSKVNKDGPTQPHMDTPCWEWACPPSHKYGQFGFQGKHYVAHRLAWELANGQEMPEELWACHRCDNPKCVNPDHIFPGTPLANSQDMIAKGRAKFCGPNNQAKGEKINTAKLTDAEIQEIRRRRDGGEELLPIAMDFGITRTQVTRIALRKQWRHVPEA